MKKLIFATTVLIVLSGCSPTKHISQTIDAALREDPGWNMSGHVIKNNQKEIKIGIISSEMLYDTSRNQPREIKIEEDLKEEGFILGIHLKKNF